MSLRREFFQHAGESEHSFSPALHCTAQHYGNICNCLLENTATDFYSSVKPNNAISIISGFSVQ